MKKLLSTTALIITLSFSGAAFAADPSDAKPDTQVFLDHAIAKFSKADAHQFKETMATAHEQNMQLADQIHSLRADLDTILTSDTLDSNAFAAKSAELRGVYQKMRENTDQAFIAAVTQLSPAERQSLVAAMDYTHEKRKEAAKSASAAQ
jgi:uncharacterized membrane protein